MKYKITFVQDWMAPYSYGSDDICRHMDICSYEMDSLELTYKALNDILDAPIAELSLEQIKSDFKADPSFEITDESKLVNIQRYYNGRLGMLNKIIEDISDISSVGHHMRYDIPEDYNHYDLREDCPVNERQNAAYIEIETIP